MSKVWPYMDINKLNEIWHGYSYCIRFSILLKQFFFIKTKIYINSNQVTKLFFISI